MDIASVVGLILAIALILGSVVIGGGSFSSFVDIPSALVVIGGAIAACMISFPLKSFLAMPTSLKVVFLNKQEDVREIIKTIVSLAETARRDGLLALETRANEVENKFISLGIQMAVDGTRPEVMEDIMRTEMEAIATRHRNAKKVFDQLGRFAPAYGMIGTLMGLIMMLSNMSDPSAIGAGMAVALITTLYGAIVSNVAFLPFAEKLGFLHSQESMQLEIIVRGIMAIQSGENPRVIEQKLNTYLPPKVREAKDEE